jgi:hypothetical protein
VPPLTRWFVKSALVYLVVSLLLGVALTLYHGDAHGALMAVYVHLFMVGWVTQMIFGVAYWMFPRLSRDEPRRSGHLALAIYVTLNAGLIMRAVAEPVLVFRPGGPWAGMLILSGVLQWLAALAFAVNTWARVKVR